MREVSDFPRKIREIMTQWIPMPDGCRLAARIWLPVDAKADPVPAVLEYLPYRRRDGTAMRDAINQPYIAGHGYAAVRVDVRGTGDSQGILTDEYDVAEIADGVAIVAWLAAQPWCSGRVGMWGISWGGFNALLVAAQAPPALAAIMPMGFAHDRYNGDCHHMGGCLLEGTMSWGNTFLAGTSRPPDPAVVGEAWRAQWLARLGALEHPIGLWLSHQRRDDYWKRGSVCEDFSRIKAAVYAVSGWQDSYARNVFPLVEGLTSPWKALIGPWAHGWPHMAVPGPRIGFLQEALRWWDHWLKDIDTGFMDEPRVRIWMGTWTEPRRHVPNWPGHWVALPGWPAPDAQVRVLFLTGQGVLLPNAPTATPIAFSTPQTLGLTAGYQCSYGIGPDLSDDQRSDDAESCCFDTPPLDHDVAILGAPILSLDIASDQPQAMIAARLCDVAPDGGSLRISYGLLNLSHRDGPEAPAPMKPGTTMRIRVDLSALAHRVPAGHRIRVALSTTYWPIAWPSPGRPTLTLATGQSTLALPLYNPTGADTGPNFAEPEGAARGAIEATRARPADAAQDRIAIDPQTCETRLTRNRDRGAWHAIDTDIAYDATGLFEFFITPDDPLTARQEFTLITTLGRPGWRTSTRAWSRLTTTPDAFVLSSRLEAFEDDRRVFEKDWHRHFPRDHV